MNTATAEAIASAASAWRGSAFIAAGSAQGLAASADARSTRRGRAVFLVGCNVGVSSLGATSLTARGAVDERCSGASPPTSTRLRRTYGWVDGRRSCERSGVLGVSILRSCQASRPRATLRLNCALLVTICDGSHWIR